MAGSKTVEMLKPFCWPGVGARNPLLTLARTKAKRAETLPLVVVPKSSKCSTRSAPPTVQSPSTSLTSRSAYAATLLRLHVPAASGP